MDMMCSIHRNDFSFFYASVGRKRKYIYWIQSLQNDEHGAARRDEQQQVHPPQRR